MQEATFTASFAGIYRVDMHFRDSMAAGYLLARRLGCPSTSAWMSSGPLRAPWKVKRGTAVIASGAGLFQGCSVGKDWAEITLGYFYGSPGREQTLRIAFPDDLRALSGSAPRLVVAP
ncbi:MAG: hypothetical protein M3N13_01180, partial [Candidatus Eremiobacteraeota bacterium]|nr:hypothetical protein [Candidatus Eremiobacteraeota bacterium]